MVCGDLHMHTYCSDGDLAPRDLLQRAAKVPGLQAIAITDHDTLVAYEELEGQDWPNLNVIVGVELSCIFAGRNVHVLAYGMPADAPALNSALANKRSQRVERIERLIKRLSELGVQLELDDVLAHCESENTNPGRPHVARAMITKGIVRSIDEAFARFLGDNRPGYVPSPRFDLNEATTLVHSCGGKAVIAHPGLYFNRADRIDDLVKAGVDGIEAFHPSHPKKKMLYWQTVAEEKNLLVTGGSDFHSQKWGGKNHGLLGSCGLNAKQLDQFLSVLAQQ